ncbi:hypothetical protein HanPSC8_Chr10g0406681 [Helianthus annuus]|nr:hypothetical protein HanPSC8_Chr10g0406681 [Helianthus annuus]
MSVLSLLFVLVCNHSLFSFECSFKFIHYLSNHLFTFKKLDLDVMMLVEY